MEMSMGLPSLTPRFSGVWGKNEGGETVSTVY